MRDIFSGDGHGCTEFVSFGEDVGVKERFADDAHGQVSHLLIDVNDGAIRPDLLNLLAVMPHDGGIAGNMTWLEGRGHELALAAVEIAFTTEDAITNHGTKGIMTGNALAKVEGLFDQNDVEVLRFVEQDAGERPEMHARDVACTRHTLKEVQAIFAEPGQVPDKWIPINVVKCFFVVDFCFNLHCQDKLLINLASALCI